MKKLTRSRNNKVFSGVFAGLGEYFGIDATIFRILFIIIGLSNPFNALLIYGLSTVIIPEDDGVIYSDNGHDNSSMFIGIGLILIGGFLLARMYLPSLNIIFPSFKYIIRKIKDFWPILLILLGVYVIVNQKKSY